MTTQVDAALSPVPLLLDGAIAAHTARNRPPRPWRRVIADRRG